MQNHFWNFLLSGWLTTPSNYKSCTICLVLMFTFEAITTWVFLQMNPHLCQVVVAKFEAFELFRHNNFHQNIIHRRAHHPLGLLYLGHAVLQVLNLWYSKMIARVSLNGKGATWSIYSPLIHNKLYFFFLGGGAPTGSWIEKISSLWFPFTKATSSRFCEE